MDYGQHMCYFVYGLYTTPNTNGLQLLRRDYMCYWGFGICKAPNTDCPYWMGICCELDEAYEHE